MIKDYTFECCKCAVCWDDECYKYYDEIYCWDCLINELINNAEVQTSTTTTYYSTDSYYGNDDNIEEVVENITNEFEIERIDCR